MNLYISDLHFGHQNVIRFDHRPFADVEEMDRTLIELWNYRVQPEDTVYIVGDLCYRSSRTPAWYLQQLKGHKVLILGNHDQMTLKDHRAVACLDDVCTMLNVKDGEENVVLCHYPIAEWQGFHRGKWMIYGHIHNRRDRAYHYMKTLDHALNAGCMINGYAPASLKELIRNNRAFREQEGDMETDGMTELSEEE